MAAATGERAPAFTSEELEKLVDGVLLQYALLYRPPDQQVSAHQKIDIWRAIAKDVRTLGVHNRRGTHCRKRWEDIRRGSRKTAVALLGMASQRRRGGTRQLTPLMSRILAVAYPDLDGHVRTSQQTQGATSASSKGTASPPPGKKSKKGKARCERPETAASKGTTMAPSGSGVPPGTSTKGGKGHRESRKDGKGSTADKSGSRQAAQEGPTSPIPGVKEDTHGPGTPAQEGPASEKSDGE
ncbi:hypothetical protein NDU88_002707 [Pleurodeles waltl]|uniref:Myb/SANT-like DNA-binding domain-containing protein n=1 Tax=Pleurodeles waltl TaxID=8319 RepID=A0AAV7TP16_PLEWA|nr:hypothetical protein NDU88_002707 [Pleurodeles waltl]